MRTENQVEAELKYCRELHDEGRAQDEYQTQEELEERIATLRWVLDDG